eukprot:tig00021038_g17569.t1
MEALVDVHAHLADSAFAGDLDGVLQRAADAGVAAIVAVSEVVSEAEQILRLSERHAILRPSAGLHPVQAGGGGGAGPDELERVLRFAREHSQRLVCIGEVGLDYSPWLLKEDPDRVKGLQQKAFAEQIALAAQLGLPLNVHSRNAGHHAISFLIQHKAPSAVLHAYDGAPRTVQPALDAGYYFSIPPCIVRIPAFQKLVERVPLDRLLLESDAPALAPEKGARNEPANVTKALEMVAAVKGVSAEEARTATARSAAALFPRLQLPSASRSLPPS